MVIEWEFKQQKLGDSMGLKNRNGVQFSGFKLE
jgi:hypothetical protein